MKPLCKTDEIIGTYIQSHGADDFHDILSADERLEAAQYLSELVNGLFGWYPFHMESGILQVGSWFGAFTEMLRFRCKTVTVLEQDPYRILMTEKRLKGMGNVKVVNQDAIDYCKEHREKFDYIIFAIDEKIDVIPDVEAYTDILNAFKGALKDDGKILFAVPNRFGVKYFCGAPDPDTKLSFDGMTEHNSGLFRFDRKELLGFMKSLGFRYVKLYYPMPDHHHAQLIYTDEARPEADVLERLHIYSDYKTKRVLDEWVLTGRMAENGVMHCFSNSFLVEAGASPCCGVIYSALSVERGRDRAFATNIYDNGTVEKVPIYPDGKAGIKRLLDNTGELSKRGIPVLKMEEKNGRVVMKRIQSPSLSSYIRDVSLKDEDMFIQCIDKLQEYIHESSEHVEAEKNCMRDLNPEADWGVILRKAYIEMIPVNSFCDNGEILFYDQEFTKDNCPANYVMFRALRDIYAFSPDADKRVSLEVMKERYGLASTWDLYAQEEERFQRELRQRNIYSGFFYWVKHLFDTVRENRRRIGMEEENEPDYFNIISNWDERRIILFGSGKMAEHYFDKYGMNYLPVFLTDNNREKWGSSKFGVEIKKPNEITKLMDGTYLVVIAIKDYKPIASQLENMGVSKDSYRIYSREIDKLIEEKLRDTVIDGKYNVGYTAGVFDQFDMTHLPLLKQCKKHSHYLVVGVYTDELLMEMGKESKIPLEERLEMVRQCKYVDRVIAVDSSHMDEVQLWRELKFGCLFMDEDYEKMSDRVWLRRKLKALGSDVKMICG